MRPTSLLLLLFACLAATPWSQAQDAGVVDVRLFGAEGQDEGTAVWADQYGILMAGETTSNIVMAEGQATWAPGGPEGRKGFVAVFDTALDYSWSFAFAGATGAPIGAPSSVVVRDVVRSPVDSATAWILYDAPVAGQWESTLLGVHPDEGIVARHTWSTSGAVTSTALIPAGAAGFMWVGTETPSAAPEGSAGIRLGLWDGQVESPPTFAWLEGTEAYTPVAADWHADTLSIAALGPDTAATSTVLRVAVVSGNPTLVGMAPIADPELTIADVSAGPEGIAWSGTLVSEDGTLDAVFGRLASAPDLLEPALWGQEWIQVTVSAEDRPARSLMWTGDVVQCAARTTTEGAGGTGILVQTRFGPTGAWFGAHTFGGEGEEEIGDMALDHEGRLIIAGSSTSWTGLGTGNGSHDAALFRIPMQQISAGFETIAEQAVLPEAAFVGLETIDSSERSPSARIVEVGTAMPFDAGVQWSVVVAAGLRIAEGRGGQWTCTAPQGWYILTTSDRQGNALRQRIWVTP